MFHFDAQYQTPQRSAKMADSAQKRTVKRPRSIYNKPTKDSKEDLEKTLVFDKANLSQIGLTRLYNRLYPGIRMNQRPVKISAYRDIVTANQLTEGIRTFTGNSQDVMQFCFLDCAEFQALAYANDKSTDATTQSFPKYETAIADWRNDVMADNESLPFMEKQITPNRELLLEKYLISLNFTNNSELDLCFEIAEVYPKDTIYDRILYGKKHSGTAPLYSGQPLTPYLNDPLSCINRDLGYQNSEADHYNTTTVANNIKDQTGHIITGYGQRLYTKRNEQFNRFYTVKSKSYFKLAGGNALTYNTGIAGFCKKAEFNQLQTQFVVPDPHNSTATTASNTSTFQYAIAPSYEDFTKFIVIKAWSPQMVTSDANDTSLGPAGGQYSVTLSKTVNFRGLFVNPEPLVIEVQTSDGGANPLEAATAITLANTEFYNEVAGAMDQDLGTNA